MLNNDETVIDILKNELKKRNNPTDLKTGIIGVCVSTNPVIISISDGLILLKEGQELVRRS